MPSRVSTTKRITAAESMADLDLLLDMLGEVVDVLDAHAARIDQFDEAFVELHEVRDAVAGHAGRRVDNGQALAGEPIEKAQQYEPNQVRCTTKNKTHTHTTLPIADLTATSLLFVKPFIILSIPKTSPGCRKAKTIHYS